MAIVSKFVTTSATVDLNDGSDGFQLSGQGWFPAVASPVYMGYAPPIVEVMHLRLRQTSHNNIATYMQALHAMQVDAEKYINDPTEIDPVWLHAKLDNETEERRALVRRIEVQYGSSWYGDAATSLDIPLTITVTREPFWEDTTARNMPYNDLGAGIAKSYDYTAAGAAVTAHDTVGDVGARVDYLQITHGTAAVDVMDVWMGIRSASKADPTKYENLWEAEDGTVNVAIATTSSATAASGGDYVNGTPTGDDTWEEYFRYYLSNTGIAAGDCEEMYGLHKFLCRIKASATSTFEVRLGYTYGASTIYVYGPTIEISNTSWLFVDLGNQRIPLNDPNFYTYFASVDQHSFSVVLFARRTSGTANLHIDCLCPIPLDEGYLSIKDAYCLTSYDLNFTNSPKGTMDAFTSLQSTDAAVIRPELDGYNFVLPPGDGRIFVVWQDTTSDIDNDFIFNTTDAGKYFERWLSLRGSE